MHPRRITGLVYLNSAEDPTADFSGIKADRGKLPAAMRNTPPPYLSSFAAHREWQLRTHGVALM